MSILRLLPHASDALRALLADHAATAQRSAAATQRASEARARLAAIPSSLADAVVTGDAAAAEALHAERATLERVVADAPSIEAAFNLLSQRERRARARAVLPEVAAHLRPLVEECARLVGQLHHVSSTIAALEAEGSRALREAFPGSAPEELDARASHPDNPLAILGTMPGVAQQAYRSLSGLPSEPSAPAAFGTSYDAVA